MTAARVKALFALALMIAALVGAQAWRPRLHMSDQRPKTDLGLIFPKQFGDWVEDTRMPVQLVSPDQLAVLNKIYNQTLSRTYTNTSGDRIMLSVAYGGDQSDGTRAHRPEVCYPAQGFQVASKHTSVLNTDGGSFKVQRLVAQLGSRVEPITYWVMVGERVAVSGTDQKLAQLSYSIRGTIPDGMLVRVSSIDPDPNRAYAQQRVFINALQRAVRPDDGPRVFGRGEPESGRL